MASSGGLPPPMQYPDGTLQQRDRGTPQGSAVSPVLANLFLHYAFDAWMGRVFPAVPFERYADDGVVHCVSRRQAQYVRRAIGDRMAQVGLRRHPTRPGVVYCKDGSRRGSWSTRPSRSWGTRSGPAQPVVLGGNVFAAFLPAISKEALKRLSRTVRRWQLHRRTELSLAELAEMINPVVRGWMQYYGAFYRSALSMLLARINTYLGALDPQEVPTATCPQEGPRSLGPRHHAVPRLLRPMGVGQVPRDDQDGTSGVTGDCHAPFRGSPG
jgi:RNA-directed DNA polymerase